MTFPNSNSLTSHLEELRSPNLPSTTSENSKGYTTPSRYSGSFMTTHSQSSSDGRANLQRRFTTDLGKMSTLTPIGQPPASKAEPVEISTTVATVEKKRLELEYLREQSHQVKQLFDEHKQELDQMTQDLNRVNLFAGHQSEPTTPPEYRDNVFPSASVFSRSNRYSVSSLASPPGMNNRSSRSGSQLTSPPTELAQTLHNHISSDTLPSKSVPGSRRGSNDRVSAYIPEMNGTSQRASTNRYSMPVTGSKKRQSEMNSDFSSVIGPGHIGFLFGDDDDKSTTKKDSTTSPDVSSYLQMSSTDDKFPILVQRKDNPGWLSASSAALDLALSQSPGPDSVANAWPQFPRHRQSQHSLPHNVFQPQQNDQLNYSTPTSVSQQSPEAIGNSRQSNRRSMEASLVYGQATLPSQAVPNENGRPLLSAMPSSFSTNDIPTMKSGTNGLGGIVTPTKTQAEQQFHNHNASLGRIPLHGRVVANRGSRELPGGEIRREDLTNGYQYFSSALQNGAAPFGHTAPTTSPMDSMPSGIVQMNVGQQYAAPAFYGGYGMQLTNMGMAPMPMANTLAFNSQVHSYPTQSAFANYAAYAQPPRFATVAADSQARVMQQRRLQNGEENSRFTNVKLEQVRADIYALCKDQHGCRYLQRKLEEENPEHVHIIFLETNQHVVELMTDPFGNYLCQKLLEFSDEDQRTVLINNAAPQMVKIALNQHGTRALQKMIEFITTREQIQTIIHALQDKVVDLIQDLNGNHVIQKCLNRLSPEDAQFIFDGVGNNCIVVGTHRHGCCVLQRCIDHASGHQKAHLIRQITANAFTLVQDPFGNYVVQYIVDLAEPAFTDPLCYSFQGKITLLSKQKFSSNVIEKCLRGAQHTVTRMMIEEMLNANELENMLSDCFANYVIQTAIDYADPDTKSRLVDAIRPIMPSIRHTPYGRRIQGKMIGSEGQQGRGRLSSGPATPNDLSSPGQIPLSRSMHPVLSGSHYGSSVANGYQGMNNSYISAGPATYQTNANINHHGPFTQPTTSSSAAYAPIFSNPSPLNYSRRSSDENKKSVQQPKPSYSRTSQSNGFNYF